MVEALLPLAASLSYASPMKTIAVFYAAFLTLLSVLCGATLELTIVDESNASIPCRVLVRGVDGKCVVPNDPKTITLEVGPDTWFMSPGMSRLEVPNGETWIRVERGHEYERHKETLTLGDGLTKRSLTLKRWISMRDLGYACGENHLHASSTELGPMLAAEGLDFGTSLTWWNGPDLRRPVPPGDGRTRTLEFGGVETPTSIFDAELEHQWGAAYLQYLPRPLLMATDPRRPNLDYLKHTVAAGGLVHYQGGWSREVGLDALLGYVHTVNLCNNNFHLHKYQPRSRYSNLLNVKGFPVYPDTEAGMLEMNTETYYRLLNWDLRLAAGAGSATGAKQTPVGYNRAYVRLSEERSLRAFNQAWTQGKNFVTNGPMLFLTVNGDQRPGDEIALPQEGDTVSVKVEALSKQPLQSVEIVSNGQVVHRFEVTDPSRVLGEMRLPVRRGSWLAARCVARDDWLTDDELAGYRRESNLPEEPSRIRFAHTSPVYMTVDGQGVRHLKALNEGTRMMDALERYAGQHIGETFRADFHSAINEAREKLEARLEETSNFSKHAFAAPGVTSLTNPAVTFTKTEAHHVKLQRNGITAIIVDNEAIDTDDLPDHRAGYSGVASLTHDSKPRDNVFVPHYAGLNFEHIHDGTTKGLREKFEPRKYAMELRIIDAHTVELYQSPTENWMLESCGRYQLLEDGTIEYTFECIPRAAGYAHDYIGLFWASYLQQPPNKAIYFKGKRRGTNEGPNWIEATSPAHGVASTHGPIGTPDLPFIEQDFPLTLVNHPSSSLYSEPWYYGIRGDMALVQIFRKQDQIWFAQSPSGGGDGNPAWDFQWFIPRYEVGQAYGFVMRMAYLPFESRAQLERVTQVHREGLQRR